VQSAAYCLLQAPSALPAAVRRGAGGPQGILEVGTLLSAVPFAGYVPCLPPSHLLLLFAVVLADPKAYWTEWSGE
jgi:hypothetical protein